MKRWFILLMCITTLTGCGAQPAGVTSSAPPADVTKESTESVIMTSAPTATPTAIPEVTPDPNRYPEKRVVYTCIGTPVPSGNRRLLS